MGLQSVSDMTEQLTLLHASAALKFSSRASLVAQLVKNLPAIRETWV